MNFGSSKSLNPLAICFLWLLCAPAIALAEMAPSEDWTNAEARPRFSLVFSVGGLAGGPASGLADRFREAGYDDVSPGFFGGGPYANPTEIEAGGIRAFSARWAITQKWAIGAGFAYADLGGANGYKAGSGDPLALGEHIDSYWDGNLLWLTASWSPADWFRIGGGPGVYFLDSDDYPWGTDISETRIGATIEAGVTSPNLGWFVLDAALRWHLIPSKEVTATTLTSEVTVEPQWTSMEFSVGLGIRI